jgi:hypothetical protein
MGYVILIIIIYIHINMRLVSISALCIASLIAVQASQDFSLENALTQVTGTLDFQDQVLYDSIKNSYDELKKDFDSRNVSERVKNITGVGISDYSQSATIQNVKGLRNEYFDRYTTTILNKFPMPPAVKDEVYAFFQKAKNSEENQWNMHRTMFSSDEQGSTHVVCLMSLRTPENKFNIYSFSNANSIIFAPNVTIITTSNRTWFGLFNKTEQKIVQVPQNLTKEDMIAVSDYFDLVIYDRFLRYFDSSRLSGVLENSIVLLTEGEDPTPKPRFAGYFEVLDAVQKTYDLAFKMFSSSSKTEIVQSFTKLGFASYENDVSISTYVGVLSSNIDRLKEGIIRTLNVPADKKDEFLSFIDLADIGDSQSWVNYQSFLRSDNAGGASSIQIFFNFDEQNSKHNVFVTKTKTKFQVADDVYVMKKSKSTFGGMFQSEKIDFKRQSHQVTTEDAELLMTFFDVIALKKFQATLDLMKPVMNLAAIE